MASIYLGKWALPSSLRYIENLADLIQRITFLESDFLFEKSLCFIDKMFQNPFPLKFHNPPLLEFLQTHIYWTNTDLVCFIYLEVRSDRCPLSLYHKVQRCSHCNMLCVLL